MSFIKSVQSIDWTLFLFLKSFTEDVFSCFQECHSILEKEFVCRKSDWKKLASLAGV